MSKYEITNAEKLSVVADAVSGLKNKATVRYVLMMANGERTGEELRNRAAAMSASSTPATLDKAVDSVNILCARFGIEPPAIITAGSGRNRRKLTTATGRAILLMEKGEVRVEDIDPALRLEEWVMDGGGESFQITASPGGVVLDYLRARHANSGDPLKLTGESKARYHEVDNTLAQQNQFIHTALAENDSPSSAEIAEKEKEQAVNAGKQVDILLGELEDERLTSVTAIRDYVLCVSNGVNEEVWEGLEHDSGAIEATAQLLRILATISVLNDHQKTRFNLVADTVGVKRLKKPFRI